MGQRAETEDLVQFITCSTGLNESGVQQVLLELRDAVLFYNWQGRPVKLEGLGTYTPVIQLNGEFKVGHRADMALKRGLNTSGEFRGDIKNRENAGKSSDEVVAMWNEEHPDDPVA